MDGLEEKFTRCPQCRSYSIASTPPKINYPFLSRFVKRYNHYHCRNCGHNFKQLAGDDNTFYSDHSKTTGRKRPKALRFLLLLPLLLLVATIVIFLANDRTGNESDTGLRPPPDNIPETLIEQAKTGETTPEPTIDNPSATTVVDESTDQAAATAEPESEAPNPEPPSPPVIGTIDLAGRSRFGVNWVGQENGLRITRLSDGPLMNAGLKVGDVITHVNNTAITSDALVMNFRDSLIQGAVSEGYITIHRENGSVLFKMINSALQKKKPSGQESILLFPQEQLRIRNSSPTEESANRRWIYKTKTITLTRQVDQKFYVSGNPDSLQPWAVDNILLISRNAIPGLQTPILPDTPTISRNHCREPLEITAYFPAQQTMEVTFSLVDLGIKWGNTDIYLLVK